VRNSRRCADASSLAFKCASFTSEARRGWRSTPRSGSCFPPGQGTYPRNTGARDSGSKHTLPGAWSRPCPRRPPQPWLVVPPSQILQRHSSDGAPKAKLAEHKPRTRQTAGHSGASAQLAPLPTSSSQLSLSSPISRTGSAFERMHRPVARSAAKKGAIAEHAWMGICHRMITRHECGAEIREIHGGRAGFGRQRRAATHQSADAEYSWFQTSDQRKRHWPHPERSNRARARHRAWGHAGIVGARVEQNEGSKMRVEQNDRVMRSSKDAADKQLRHTRAKHCTHSALSVL